MRHARALALLLAAPLCARAQGPVNRFGNPAKVAPAPTTPAISVRDLQIRLYQFADDSMQGRQVGRIGNKKGTDYIAAEVKRLGLVPAGDDGTYFQVLPYHLRKFTSHSRLTVDGNEVPFFVSWGERDSRLMLLQAAPFVLALSRAPGRVESRPLAQ